MRPGPQGNRARRPANKPLAVIPPERSSLYHPGGVRVLNQTAPVPWAAYAEARYLMYAEYSLDARFQGLPWPGQPRTASIPSDIQGIEDALGDMDLNYYSRSVTALQMDIKIGGVSCEIVEAATHRPERDACLYWAKCWRPSPSPMRNCPLMRRAQDGDSTEKSAR